jgi:uncharacterized membrane-anchored protein
MNSTSLSATIFVRVLLPGILSLLSPGLVCADEPKLTQEQAKALVSGLNFQQGEISLQNGLATVRVPESLRYLNGKDANTVLVKLWGNPPQSEPLGMLMPAGVSPISAESWAVIMTYEEDGYVKDEEAEKIDYSKLLTEMKQGVEEQNAERQKAGYGPIHLVGWAKAPYYDQKTHKLYWAKELKFGDNQENTLNYNIRMLGRGGVLVLNAVAEMTQLPQIEQATPKILAAVEFNPGRRYTDFKPGSDKVATYGLAALVAGGVAAKLGFFKGLWVAILAAKKIIIVAVVAIGAWLRKLFGKKTLPRPNEQVTGPSL